MSKATTTQSQVILARATKGMEAAAATVGKAVADLQSLTALSAETVLKIEDLQIQAAELAAQNEKTRREAAAELKVRVLEDREKVLAELLKEQSLARLTNADLQALQVELATVKAKDGAEQAAAVAAAVTQVKATAAAEALQVEAANKVATATKDAQIASLTDKVAFLQTQVQQLQAQVEAERTTRVQIAQAESARQGVIVNTAK